MVTLKHFSTYIISEIRLSQSSPSLSSTVTSMIITNHHLLSHCHSYSLGFNCHHPHRRHYCHRTKSTSMCCKNVYMYLSISTVPVTKYSKAQYNQSIRNQSSTVKTDKPVKIQYQPELCHKQQMNT